jgi:hypothetical protein
MPKRNENQKSSDNNESQISIFFDFAKASVKEISIYTNSEKEEDKLIGFNAILALLCLDFIITGLLLPNSSELVSKIIILFIFGIIAAAMCGIYLYLMVMIANLINKDIFALKLSIGILIFIVCLTLSGLFLPKQIFLEWGFILFCAQIILIIVIGFLKIPIKVNIQKSESQGSNLGIIFWNLLDKISIVGGVLGLIVLLYSWLPK